MEAISSVNRWRFSASAHGQMRFWNPLPVAGLLSLIRELALPHGAEVLDYGCGAGEAARELVDCFGAQITGVDPNPEVIARCRAKLAGSFFTEPFQAARFRPA